MYYIYHMKNQKQITEEIGKIELEIESIKKTGDAVELDNAVSEHKCLLAYKNALIWVLDMKV